MSGGIKVSAKKIKPKIKEDVLYLAGTHFQNTIGGHIGSRRIIDSSPIAANSSIGIKQVIPTPRAPRQKIALSNIIKGMKCESVNNIPQPKIPLLVFEFSTGFTCE